MEQDFQLKTVADPVTTESLACRVKLVQSLVNVATSAMPDMTTSHPRHVASSFLSPVDIDPDDGQPIYRQISDWYRKAISGGLLRPGQRVPSTRALAEELKVSRISALNAYEQLIAEGYFETWIGSGTRVARSIPDEALTPAKSKQRKTLPRDRGHSAAGHVSSDANTRQGLEWTWLKNTHALRVGPPAVEEFPNAIWSKLVNRHTRNPPRELMIYGDSMGYLPFREAVAGYLRISRAVRCEASQILVTTGSQAAVQICVHALLNTGDSVWMEEPGYFGAHFVLKAASVRIVPVPVDREGLDVTRGMLLARAARAAFITPSHQFPLGVIMSATRRMQLLNWAAQNAAWIIEDDYDSEFRFEGRPLASLQGLDLNERVIYVGTLSKSMFPSLRLGYIVVPAELISVFHNARRTFSGVPLLYQAVMTDFIREGHFARHIRRMRTLYEQRRRALIGAIHEHLAGKFEVVGAGAGLQLAGFLPSGTDDVAVSNKVAAAGISVMPLSPYYLGERSRSGLVLGYGCANAEEIRHAVRELEACL